MTDNTNGILQETLEFAKSIENDSLQKCIERLKKTDEDCDTDTMLMTDFAPRSFYFVRKDKDGNFRGNGGVIFHGRHDNGGDGGAPSFSVTLSPVNGWSIHT